MATEDFVYAVTRVHYHEMGLLGKPEIDQLMAAPDEKEVFRLLADKGWGAPDMPQNNADALVQVETAKTWDLIVELIGDVREFDVLRIGADYHNLKAAIKLAYAASDEKHPERYFQSGGTVDMEAIHKAACEHDFSLLPEGLAAAGKEAYEVLAHSGNGQACDMAIDRAALCAISKAGKASKSELLRNYANITVDSANIKAAVRCQLMGKSREFIEKALAPAGTLNTQRLGDAVADGMDAIYAYLHETAYAGAEEALRVSVSVFERWCDNQLMDMIRPQRKEYFGVEPLAAFILGRQNEIAMARLILSAKINRLDADAVRERLREMYV